MSETAKTARKAMKDKAQRLIKAVSGPVDASGYTVPDAQNADIKTGMRPISKRQFKRGGKTVANPGMVAKFRADRKARKSGGRALSADSLMNRNVKEANEEREGIKHIGGMKRGGKIKKSFGGDVVDAVTDGSKAGIKSVTGMKRGGNIRKADGGDVEAARAIQDLMSAAQTKQSMPMPNRAKPVSRDAALAAMTKEPVLEANPAPKKAPAKVPLSEQGYIGTPEDYRMAKLAAAQNEAAVRAAGRAAAASGRDGKPYQKGGMAKFEDSAKDKMQDRKLAKKYKMSPKEWEASEMDEKHDKQQSMKGLKHGGEVHHASCSCKKCGGAAYAGGGSVSDGSFEGTRPMPGGRMARKHGGRTGKGKMSVNIIIGAGGPPQGGLGGMPPMGPDGVPGNPFGPKAGMPPMPAPPPPPPPMPPMGPPPGMMPPPMGRKAGGRVGKAMGGGFAGGMPFSNAGTGNDMRGGMGASMGNTMNGPMGNIGGGMNNQMPIQSAYPNPMGAGATPPMAGTMARKSGGRTNKVAHMMAEEGGGGGSGVGRLEKIKAYDYK